MDITEKILKNKVKTIFINSKDSRVSCIQIWFKAGSALEDSTNLGMAHFLEHMFFKGTQDLPGTKIAEEVESHGGEINAFTSFDYTCYYINCQSKQMEKSLSVLLDMVANPAFPADDFKAEREVVFEEYRRSQDNPSSYSFQKMQKNFFPKGYSHPILGNEKTIKSFSRKQLLQFRKKFYNTNNMICVVAGSIQNIPKIEKLIEKFKFPKGPNSDFPKFELKKKSLIDLHQKDVPMAQLTFAINASPYSNDNAPAEDIAMSCLGHGESSRFYNKLIHKTSLANYFSSSTLFFNKGGIHFIKFSAPSSNLENIYNEFYNVLDHVLINGLTEEEIVKIKNQYMASKIYEKESLESFAFSIGHAMVQTETPEGEIQYIEKIKKSSLHQVQSVLKDIFTRNIYMTLQIPNTDDQAYHQEKLSVFNQKIIDLQKNIKSKLQNKEKKYKIEKSKYDKSTQILNLAPGIKLIHRKNNLTPTFVFHGYIQKGLANENEEDNGIHNLIGHLLTKGYGDLTNEELQKILENKVASISSVAGKNTYGVTLHGQSPHTEELFEHFFNSLIGPSFLEEQILHEKEMILRQMKNHQKDPIKQCFKKFSSIIFKDHPYSQEIYGTIENLEKIQKESLKERHLLNLKEGNIVFVYSGDQDVKDILYLLNSFLKKFPTRSFNKHTSSSFIKQYGQSDFIPFDREQSQIVVGLPTFDMKNKNDIYLKILSCYLSGQSSKLFVRMRDELGLCYTVQPIHLTALEGGYWGIYMASGYDKTEDAISEIKNILNEVKEKGLTQKEFIRVKKMLRGQLELGLDTNDDYANSYSIPTLYGFGLDYIYENHEKISNANLSDFNKFIKKFLNSSPNIVVAGREELQSIL